MNDDEPTNQQIAGRATQAFKRKVARELAMGRRYTKAELSRQVGEAPQVIQHFLNDGILDKRKLPKFADELEVSVDWLLNGREDVEHLFITNHRDRALLEIFQQLPQREQERIFREIQDAEQRRREKIDTLLRTK